AADDDWRHVLHDLPLSQLPDPRDRGVDLDAESPGTSVLEDLRRPGDVAVRGRPGDLRGPVRVPRAPVHAPAMVEETAPRTQHPAHSGGGPGSLVPRAFMACGILQDLLGL